jgi:hypothetical protein
MAHQPRAEDEGVDEHEIAAQQREQQWRRSRGGAAGFGERGRDQERAAVENEPGGQTDATAGATFSAKSRIERSASAVGNPGSAMSSSTRW